MVIMQYFLRLFTFFIWSYGEVVLMERRGHFRSIKCPSATIADPLQTRLGISTLFGSGLITILRICTLPS